MHARRLAAVLIAFVVSGPSGRAFADVDLTGSRALFAEGAGPGTIDIVQTGSTLTLSSGGVPLPILLATIDPQTGVFQVVFQGGTPCPAGFVATASADGNAFAGYGGQTEPSCPGGIMSCMCTLVQRLGVRGCRIGAPGACCGDGVVAPGEQCDNGPEAPPGLCCTTTCQITSPGGQCTSDANLCTLDVCDGAGICTHTAGPAGAACGDDGNVCTLDACDGAGVCMHPPGSAGATCSDDGDVCTLDVCDATGTCGHPSSPDSDGDGICDAVDLCTGGAAIENGRLKIGSDRVTIKGEAMVPPGPPLDPVLNGLGFRVDVTEGGFTRVIPGGPWVAATRTGWKGNGTATAFRYRDPASRITLALSRRTPGRVRIAITRFGDDLGLSGFTPPIDAIVLFDAVTPGSRCAEVRFASPTCATHGAVLSCR